MTTFDSVDQIQAAWQRERPDLQVGSIGVLTRIRRIARVLDRHRSDLLRRLGTDASTLDLLATLRRAGRPYEMTPGELARRSLITSGGVSQRLAKAERAGLVQRRPSGADGRSTIVGLTPEGFRMVDDIVDEIFRTEEELVATIVGDDRQRLVELLRELLASVDVPPTR